MFDRDALELIQQTAVLAADVKCIANGLALVVPDRTNIQSAEPYADGRFRFRGTYRTNTLAELIGYTSARRDAAATPPVVFVNAEDGEAKAFFNLGTVESPGHGDDTAQLSLKRTAGYAALLQHTGRPLKQRELAEFLEDWFDCVAPTYPDNDLPVRASISAAIAAIRDITVTKTAETNSEEKELMTSASAFAQVEAKSKNRLPTGFHFTVKPYDGFEDRGFNLRLSVQADDEKGPRLALRIVGLSDVTEQIAAEFEQKLRAGLDGVPVYRGTFTP